jgi:hypothetical protein
MSFSNRKYEFYLIFGKITENHELWRRETWTTVYEPIFRRILELSPEFEKTGIRVLEYGKKEETDQYMSEIKLGRLKWNKKSHDKWTLDQEDKRFFNHFESWTPIWTICEKTDKSPDIYISIWNEKYLGEEKHYEFDIFVTIAIAEDLQVQTKEHIQELSRLLQSRRTVFNIRTWGRGKQDKEKGWEFINWIQDTSSFGIYKKGKTLNLHDTKFETIEFEPYWETLYKE